tara:strand:+ start:747 stop:1376 length:630 start_codon:yes stop_codon:yes gene_type:complete
MAVLWDKFYPYIQPYLPGCPEVVIETHLKEAAADFFARSEIWRFDIDPDFTSASTKDYELDTPTNAVLENIYELLLDDQCITRISDRHVNISRFTTNGKPIYYAIYQDTSVRFYPTPDKKYTFSGIGVLKPSLAATGVEDWIYETYGRCISYGAISRLAEVPGKEWHNPELAGYYRSKFDMDADMAKSRDYRRVNLRVGSRSFDGSRRY